MRGRRFRELVLATLLGLALLGAPAARADGGSEVSGVVRDGQGRPLPGADVVVVPENGGARAVAITDGQGAFLIPLADAGAYRVNIYSSWGGRVDTRQVVLAAGARLHLEVTADGGPAPAGIPRSARADGLPWLISEQLGAAALAPGRDLAGALAAVPGSPPAPASGDGPLLLGTDPGQAELRLQGFSLNDPVEGRAPWQLPVSLWGQVLPRAGAGLEGDGASARGGAGVDLTAARAEQAAALELALGGGAVAAAAEIGRPQGRAGLGFLEARAQVVRRQWRGTLATAPTRGPWQNDPGTLAAARGRQTLVLPLLARADGQLGSWNLTGVGLLSLTRQELSRAGDAAAAGAGSISALEDTRQRRHDLVLAGLRVQRPLGPAPAQFTLAAGWLGSRREERPLMGGAVTTDARRLTLEAGVLGHGHWGGRHLVSAAAGVDAEAADRSGGGAGAVGLSGAEGFASRQAGQRLLETEASSYSPWVAFEERWLPLPELELQAGLRAEKIMLRAAGQGSSGPLPDRSFSTDFLWAPRARVALVPLSWSSGRVRVQVAGGRFGARLPLAPLLDRTAAPRFGLEAPAEDALTGGADLTLGPLRLTLGALERRLAHAVEDRFSPVDGQLELYEPLSARRRYRALWAELSARLGGLHAAVAVLRSSLRGDHLGWLDAASGAARPASSEAFDTPASEINRDGALLLDRGYGARFLLEHGQPLTPALRLAGALAARIDGGSPRAALGPNPESPQSRVYLVQAGSLPRTRAVAALDAALALAVTRGRWRGSLRLELLNLGNRRSVITRDPLYTDVATAPRSGARGREGLAGLTDAAGLPVPARSNHDAPLTRAEPFTARLVLGLAL